MDTVKGYCQLKRNNNAFIGLSKKSPDYDKVKESISNSSILPIMDIAVDGNGFLCLAPNGSCIIDVQSMDDVDRYFLCEDYCGVLIPSNLSTVDKMYQVSRRIGRKGGYGPFIKKVIIAASLQKGELYDEFLLE